MAGRTNSTKNDIVDLAIRMITENGYQSISLRKLLGRLHLTTGSFYKQLASKDALFEAASIRISQRFTEQAAKAIGHSPDAMTRLIDLGEFVVQKIASQPFLTDFLFFNPSTASIYSSTEEAPHFELLDLTHQVIDSLSESPENTNSEGDLFIKLWSFIQGYGLLIRNGAVRYNRQFLKSVAYQLIDIHTN